MTPTTLIRLVQALVLAAAVGALATPAVALAGSSRSNPAPDWFERFVAAHPDGHGVIDQRSQVAIDHRLPDTLDAAPPVQSQVTDVRSPDTLDAANGAHGSLGAIDRRSPDTLDTMEPRPAVVFAPSSGFDWSAAGAACLAIALLSLLCAAGLLWLRHRPRHRMRTT